MRITSKFKLPKRYLAFFTLVPLLAATALIKAPCPVCEGTGVVSSTGMEEVEISEMEYYEKTVFLAGCDAYRVYQYEINLVFENHGPHEAAGYVNMFLIDHTTGKLLDTQFTIAVVPAQSSIENTFTVYFTMSALIDKPEITEVQAKILLGNVECMACSGSGGIALNSWPLYNELKDTFIETHRVERPYMPPLWVETEGQAGVDY